MTDTQVTIPQLETARLTLRAPRYDDDPVFEAFLASDRARFVGGPGLDAKASWRAFAHIAGLWVLRPPSSFIITLKGRDTPLGLVGPWFPHNWPEPEIAWSLWTATHEGSGIAFEAATAARTYAFNDVGWTTAVSYIDPANKRSIALAERLGATLDSEAPSPGGTDLVYRHPAPGVLQ